MGRPKINRGPCSEEGCDKPQRCRGWCKMHYTRWQRYGTLERTSWTNRRPRPDGYIILSGQWSHPLADKRGEVFEHRFVLYEALGPGRHDCYLCGIACAWEDGTLHVDHLNDDKTNNSRENLAPSCFRCNIYRGYEGRAIREGQWSRRNVGNSAVGA